MIRCKPQRGLHLYDDINIFSYVSKSFIGYLVTKHIPKASGPRWAPMVGPTWMASANS